MDEKKLLVTAISESEIEREAIKHFIAQGWEVIHRARIYQELTQFYERHSEDAFTLLYSQGFEIPHHAPILHSSLVTAIEVDPKISPISAIHLSEEVRHYKTPRSLRILPPTTPTIVGLASMGAAAGSTTIAINLAQEFSSSGRRTLLIDGDRTNPSVASLLDIYGIHRDIVKSDHGFSCVELSTLDQVSAVSRASNQFDVMVIDCGKFTDLAQRLIGHRLGDYSMQWATELHSQLWIVSSEQELRSQQLTLNLQELRSSRPQSDLGMVLNHLPAMNRKRRAQIIADGTVPGMTSPFLLPRDMKSVRKAQSAKSTLALSAPKSNLRAAISRLSAESADWSN